MRRVASLFVVLSIIANPSNTGAADDPKMDFDQGVDAGALLDTARKAVHGAKGRRPLPLWPVLDRPMLSPEMEEMIGREILTPDRTFAPGDLRPCESYIPENDGQASGKSTDNPSIAAICTKEERFQILGGNRARKLDELSSAQAGILDDAYARIPSDSQPYKDSQHWLAQIPRLPQAQRPPFESQHRNLSGTRVKLISDGRGHDLAEVQLVERAKVLNAWGARIDARRKLIEQDRSEYNQTCIDSANPPAKLCKDWFDRANACIARHNSSIKRYQPIAAQFRADRDKHFGNVDSFKTRVRTWETQEVLPFNKAVEQALASNPAGTCDPGVWEALVKRKNNACDGGPFHCSPEEPCADLGTSVRKNEACYQAAKELNECFGQSHPEHSKTMQEASDAKNKCLEFLAAKCGTWDPHTGRCDKLEHKRLQDHVDAVCGIQSSCDQVPFKACDILREYHQRNLVCRDARDEINEVCYAGGDSGHREASSDAQKAAKKCFDRMLEDKCSSSPLASPVR